MKYSSNTLTELYIIDSMVSLSHKTELIFIGHKLLPCNLQRLPQVYWKMSVFITGVVVMENIYLYMKL